MDFLGNPIGLFNDITSGVTGVFTTTPDVMGLVRDVTHGMSDTTSKVSVTILQLYNCTAALGLRSQITMLLPVDRCLLRSSWTGNI